jgi:hypothetical protein
VKIKNKCQGTKGHNMYASHMGLEEKRLVKRRVWQCF